jgi:small subunit ribosomal protein S7
MRRPIKKKNKVVGDVVYGSEKVEKFINHIMLDGKKETARKVVYGAFDKIKEQAKVENPLEVFDMALKNAAPMMEVRSRRVGGANYQVPVEVRPERRTYLSMTWIIDAARSGKGSAMEKRLADELILASKGEGSAVKKKEDTHRMAEANKAFAHFAW